MAFFILVYPWIYIDRNHPSIISIIRFFTSLEKFFFSPFVFIYIVLLCFGCSVVSMGFYACMLGKTFFGLWQMLCL